MKIWITRNWSDKNYEVWTKEPVNWINYSEYYDEGLTDVLIMESISPKEAKEMFKLDKHLKKKEIIEAAMTFKIKK